MVLLALKNTAATSDSDDSDDDDGLEDYLLLFGANPNVGPVTRSQSIRRRPQSSAESIIPNQEPTTQVSGQTTPIRTRSNSGDSIDFVTPKSELQTPQSTNLDQTIVRDEGSNSGFVNSPDSAHQSTPRRRTQSTGDIKVPPQIRVKRKPFVPIRDTGQPSSPRILPDIPTGSNNTSSSQGASGSTGRDGAATHRSSRREGLRPKPKKTSFFGKRVSFAHGTCLKLKMD